MYLLTQLMNNCIPLQAFNSEDDDAELKKHAKEMSGKYLVCRCFKTDRLKLIHWYMYVFKFEFIHYKCAWTLEHAYVYHIYMYL